MNYGRVNVDLEVCFNIPRRDGSFKMVLDGIEGGARRVDEASDVTGALEVTRRLGSFCKVA